VVVGQRHETFPNRGAHGEIQHISKNWITLWAWRIRSGRFLPPRSEDEDRDGKCQRVEHRSGKHGDRGRMRGRRAGSYILRYCER